MAIVDITRLENDYRLVISGFSEGFEGNFESFTSALDYGAEKFAFVPEEIVFKGHFTEHRFSEQIYPITRAVTELYSRKLDVPFEGEESLVVSGKNGEYSLNGGGYSSFAQFIVPFVENLCGEKRKKVSLKVKGKVLRKNLLESLVARNNFFPGSE